MTRCLSLLLLLLPAFPASAAGSSHTVWSTYYGSGGSYLGQTVAVAQDGSIVLGAAYATDCTHNCQAAAHGFILDLAADGRTVQWRKNFPGYINALVIDLQGNIVVTGTTTRLTFPVVHAFQRHARGQAAVVVKLSPHGDILFSTYLGGFVTSGSAIATDPAGNVYVAGSTSGRTLPTVQAVQPHWGGQTAPNSYGTDAFIAKFTPSGHIIYSTYLGRKQNDEANGIVADAAGNAYISGWTASTHFPTVHRLPGTACGGASAFLAEIAPSGGHLLRSTCLSHAGGDFYTHLILASDGSLFLSNNSRRLLRLAHNQLTAFGSIPHAFSVISMAPGPNGSVLLTGSVPQGDRRTCGREDHSHQCSDAGVLEIGASGKTLLTVHLGGKADDEAHAVAAIGSDIVLTGMTASTDFPVQAPVQATNGGIFSEYNSGPVDMFITRVSAP